MKRSMKLGLTTLVIGLGLFVVPNSTVQASTTHLGNGVYCGDTWCIFKIKFDQKYLTNPHITGNENNPFGKKIDQNGLFSCESVCDFYKKVRSKYFTCPNIATFFILHLSITVKLFINIVSFLQTSQLYFERTCYQITIQLKKY